MPINELLYGYILFKTPLKLADVKYFRGAIIHENTSNSDLFHQHQKDELIYRYPLIQYKSIQNNAGIIFLNQGLNNLHSVFDLKNSMLKLNKVQSNLDIKTLNVNVFKLKQIENNKKYIINNWIPLNEANHVKFKNKNTIIEKIELLEQILKGNILSFAKGVGWNIENPIKLDILEVLDEKTTLFKKIKVIQFDIIFSCNVDLPNYIGLGKASSLGMGMVIQKNT